ncbi:hypothetical protein Y032_1214g3761 [Ancylostoma ceylanicum]|uniref:Aldehyde oxidase/xanthine dehydrogenase second molybdopterin binding domain-containing protein n=1 Tax=Ancylostoma ceylanicum TaxID=53326 RepID=A0A016W7J6_9BILA|nr:hypothetical protein Y032_1214g3761 [Ancylostoma ceylanicum]
MAMFQTCCDKLLEGLDPILKEEKDWKKAVMKAFHQKVSLQASEHIRRLCINEITQGKNVDAHFDNGKNSGVLARLPLVIPIIHAVPDFLPNPFMFFRIERRQYGIPEDSPTYHTSGAACVLLEIDCRTGEHKLLSVDIVLDVGRSLNPAIDIGQIEGAFMQCYGNMTCEELTWDKNGKLVQDSLYKYKIPTPAMTPRRFRVKLLKESNTFAEQVYSSKGVGEPPLMLGVTTFSSLRYAITARRQDLGLSDFIEISAPLTASKIVSLCNP